MSKKEIRPFWTTTVDPSEYNYRKQFSQAVKIANERKEVFPPLDIGKVWGLVESHARLERENAALRKALQLVVNAYDEEQAGGELIHRLYDVSRKARAVLAARKEAQS